MARTTGNYLRAFAGATLKAADIDHRIILVVRLRGVETTSRAVIELPSVRSFRRGIAVVDATGLGFRLVTDGADALYGDGEKRGACRLVPLLSDTDDEPDGWGIV
jgi:hypothetical protein